MKQFLLLLQATAVVSYEIAVQRSSPESRKTAYGMPLDMDRESLSYIGTVSLGTPLQDLNAAFDFSTPVFWVPEAASACGVADVTTDLRFLNLTMNIERAADSFRFAPHYRAGFI